MELERHAYNEARYWTVERLVRDGMGLRIECLTCGHTIVWSCREVFERFHCHLQMTGRQIHLRLKHECSKPHIDIQLKRDIRAWGRICPTTTYDARVAEWTAEMLAGPQVDRSDGQAVQS